MQCLRCHTASRSSISGRACCTTGCTCSHGTRENRALVIESLLRGLREHGYVEGQNGKDDTIAEGPSVLINRV